MPLSPDTMFQIANTTTLAGWLALALFPLAPQIATLVAVVIPILFSTLYFALILAFWAGAEGGYGSLPDVMRLFDTPAIALGGWVHYLAFDMLMGLWIVRNARTQRIHHLLVIPILALTFLFGPIGFIAYLILATALRRRAFA